MEKYDLTEEDIKKNINRFLTYVYSSAASSKNPQIFFIVAGPGSGKSGLEAYLKYNLRVQGEKASVVNSDKIAEFHPAYEDALAELLPEERYRVTRQFVRPAMPEIYQQLKKNRITILNEKTFSKGESDIEFVRGFKEAGYQISVNMIATDIYTNRLSCYEREARMLECGDSPRGISKRDHDNMYNAFVKEIQQLESQNLCDEINVYVRGESINRPRLVYQLGDTRYPNFMEALKAEREKERRQLFSNPGDYLMRIKKAKDSIQKNGINPILTQDSLNGLEELEEDFIQELPYERADR